MSSPLAPTQESVHNQEKGKNMKWTRENDSLFQVYLVEAKRDGLTITGGFSREGWSKVSHKMKESYGPSFAKDKCRNRYKTYKKWYGHLKQIMDCSGFGWDATKNCVAVEPLVWDDTIKQHPDWEPYRGKCMPCDYDLLCEIMGDTIANGRHDYAGLDRNYTPQSTVTNDLDDEAESEPINMGGSHGNNSVVNMLTSTANTPSSRAKRKLSAFDLVSESVVRMADVMDSLAQTQKLMVETKQKMYQKATVVGLMRTCMEGLDMLGLNNELNFRAMELLQQEIPQSTFLSLGTIERRKIWLLHMLGV